MIKNKHRQQTPILGGSPLGAACHIILHYSIYTSPLYIIVLQYLSVSQRSPNKDQKVLGFIYIYLPLYPHVWCFNPLKRRPAARPWKGHASASNPRDLDPRFAGFGIRAIGDRLAPQQRRCRFLDAQNCSNMFLKCWGNVIILNAGLCDCSMYNCTTLSDHYLKLSSNSSLCHAMWMHHSTDIMTSLRFPAKKWNTLFCCCLVILFLNPGTKKHLRFSNIPSLTQRSSRPARTLLLSKLCFRKGPGKWESSGCCQNLELDALRPTNGLVILRF